MTHTSIAPIPHEPGKQNFTASYVLAKFVLRRPCQLAAGKPNSKLWKSPRLVLTEEVSFSSMRPQLFSRPILPISDS